MGHRFEAGQRIQLPDTAAPVMIEVAQESPHGWQLFVDDGTGSIRKVLLTPELAEQVAVVAEDGAAEPSVVLAGLWAEWMRAATLESKATTLATTPLRPYAHQTNAVYAVGAASIHLAWRHRGWWYVAEVKSLTNANETKQLRLGIGQVLDYQDRMLTRNSKVRAVLVVEHRPSDARWIQLCERHEITLVWPDVLETVLLARLVA